MSHRPSPAVLTAAFLLVAGAAFGQGSQQAKSKDAVNVYQYAIDNPVDDSKLRIPPTLGESVPRAVNLVSLNPDSGYAYFYYNGRPVIVDVTTRSVVRLGQ